MAPPGITHGAVIQPSIYGTDNSALLAALAEAEGQFVGVGAVNSDVDLFTDSRLLSSIAPILRDARVPVVVDHMGRTPAALGISHSGMPQLQALLEEGWLWVRQ